MRRFYVEGQEMFTEDWAYVIRAANAFDALLAVAKAADGQELWRDTAPVVAAVRALTAAHPGWREWEETR